MSCSRLKKRACDLADIWAMLFHAMQQCMKEGKAIHRNTLSLDMDCVCSHILLHIPCYILPLIPFRVQLLAEQFLLTLLLGVAVGVGPFSNLHSIPTF
eukprot:363372-Chlamydomonas_euryale.AAC.4